MENLQPEAAAASGGIVAPKNALPQYAQALVRPPFTAAKSECVAVPLMYALAYVYIRMYLALLEDTASAVPRVLLAVFTLGFLALGESLHRDTPRKRESWVWLGCTALILVSILAQRGKKNYYIINVK